MARNINTLLLTSNSQRCRQWQKTLDGAHHFTVILESEMRDASGVPDVIVADQLPLAERLGIWSAPLQRGEIGVVAVGCTGTADVILPANHAPRELRLACRLLAQVAHLRAQLHREQTSSRLLHRLAHTDDITGLANRRAWSEHLQRQTRAGHAGSMPIGLALFDLDYFKRINGTLGHAEGDQTLKAVGQKLRALCHPPSFAARLGGDEFAVLLHLANRDRALPAVEQLRTEMTRAQTPAAVTWPVTASAGFVVLPTVPNIDVTAAMAAADAALRRAKAEGRDCTRENPL